MKASNATKIEQLLSKLDRSLQKKARTAIDEYFGDSNRKDDRGRKATELKQVNTTLKHLNNLPSWIQDVNIDVNYRGEMKDIYKHIQHGQPFETTIEECRYAAGLKKKSDFRRAHKKESGSSAVVQLTHGYEAVPLNSDEKMIAAGKRGHNCLGDRTHDHRQDRKNGVAKYYEIREINAPPTSWVWLRIDKQRRVTDIFGHDNEPADLGPATLKAICQKLKVTGDDQEEFGSIGVYSMFESGSAKRSQPMLTCCNLSFWQQRGEIVIRNDRTKSWSRIAIDEDGWSGEEWVAPSYHVDVDIDGFRALCDAIDEVREFGEAAGFNEIVGQTRPPRRNRRRRGHRPRQRRRMRG